MPSLDTRILFKKLILEFIFEVLFFQKQQSSSVALTQLDHSLILLVVL